MTHAPNQPTKLLLVDDDPDMIRLLTMVIKRSLDQAELIDIVGQALKRRRRWQKALAGTLAARHGYAPASAG